MRERRRFARFFPHVAHTRFVLLDQPYTSPWNRRFRDLAFAEPEIPRVSMLLRALDLPRANVQGLIRHELGHVADDNVDRRGKEQRADDIAEYVTGERINYDQDDIQTTARGKYPRPLHLHR